MRLFYDSMMSSRNKAEALRRAAAEIRKTYSHPFYWAPLTLVGKY
jgi:CHAT domain-containing protein